jgi:hypothetical protein
MSSERAPVAAGRLTTFMMALLAATALTAAPAWADGGAGGSGAAGGIDQASRTGGGG